MLFFFLFGCRCRRRRATGGGLTRPLFFPYSFFISLSNPNNSFPSLFPSSPLLLLSLLSLSPPFQVLSLLGPIAGSRVVELGAGIGRFTGALASEDEGAASSVLAIDFMPNLIAENERVNGHLTNAKFAVGDATELELPAGSVDVLFSNWLLMYLGDEEVSSLATRALSWVVPGGVVFFRESCFRQSGDKQRAKNPTHYRDPREYFRLFDDARGVAADGVTKVRFELVTCRCVDTYVRLKQNQNQLCWKWRVVRVEEEGDGSAAAGAAVDDESSSSKGSTPVDAPATPSRRTSSASSLGHASTSSSCAGTPRHFLDAEQYSAHSIARYERVFGRGFVTSGGEASTRALLPMLSPALQQKKQKLKNEKVAGNNPFVLDIGSGLGGAAAILAADYNCRVRGIDLSVNMVSEKVFF